MKRATYVGSLLPDNEIPTPEQLQAGSYSVKGLHESLPAAIWGLALSAAILLGFLWVANWKIADFPWIGAALISAIPIALAIWNINNCTRQDTLQLVDSEIMWLSSSLLTRRHATTSRTDAELLWGPTPLGFIITLGFAWPKGIWYAHGVVLRANDTRVLLCVTGTTPDKAKECAEMIGTHWQIKVAQKASTHRFIMAG